MCLPSWKYGVLFYFFILSLCLSYFTICIYSCLAMFGLKKTKVKRKQTFQASKLRFLCFCLFGFPQACLRISLSIRVTPTPSNWSVIGLMRGWLNVGGASWWSVVMHSTCFSWTPSHRSYLDCFYFIRVVPSLVCNLVVAHQVSESSVL